jgi:hypothetical protein
MSLPPWVYMKCCEDFEAPSQVPQGHDPRQTDAGRSSENLTERCCVQCNGDRPCNACAKRQARCYYSPSKPPRGVCIVQKPPQTLQRAHIFKTVDMSKYATVVSKGSVLDLPTRSLSVASRGCSPGHRRTPTTFRGENESKKLSCSNGLKDSTTDGISRSIPVVVEPIFLQGSTGKLCETTFPRSCSS